MSIPKYSIQRPSACIDKDIYLGIHEYHVFKTEYNVAK